MSRHSFLNRAAFVAALSLSSLVATAVPAKPGKVTYTQPDGTEVEVTIHGDEHRHYYSDAEGYVLTPDARSFLCYTQLRADGSFHSTGIKASQRPADDIRPMLATVETAKGLLPELTSSRPALTDLLGSYPTMGSPKVLVLLVQFDDVKFTIENPRQAFDDMLNKPGYSENDGTGSALDYYKENSMGRFTPDFQVFGPVTVPEPEPWYGQSTAMAYDTQAWKMIEHGCKALRADYPDLDFSQFDNDGDGYVDNVFVFYAGYGQNEGGPEWTIWPHAANLWTFYNIDVTYDGVRIGNYACTNELKGTKGAVMTGIGTFCHEYTHVLGLMDHYNTNGGSSSHTPGSWDLMDNGSYNNNGRTPPYLNAFERYSLGWLNPRRLTGPESVSLAPIQENEGLMIATEKAGEYFILENRQRTGWDAHTGGHGMLVWHIDYDAEVWNNNRVNSEMYHQRVDIVEADNVADALTRGGDPFPGTGSVRQFTATSNPAMKTWIGVDPDLPLTDIYEVDGMVTFKVKGGGDRLETVVALPATDVTPTGFTANWEAATGIHSYEVDLFEGTAVIPLETRAVKGTASAAFTGLKPATEYSYTVRAIDGDRTSPDCERMTVTTLPPSFDMIAPETPVAVGVNTTSFTASWKPMEGAAGYLVKVYTKTAVDPQVDVADFNGGVSNLLPEGWKTNCSTTGSVNGYYGEAAPALRMTYDGDRLDTPSFPGGVNSLSFAYRGSSTGTESSIAIYTLTDGLWRLAHTVLPIARDKMTTVEFNDPAPGSTAWRIVFNREAGSLYIDDVTVRHDASMLSNAVEGFDCADAGSETEMAVNGLEAFATYYFTVTAYDASGLRSLESDEGTVTLSDPASIESVVTSASSEAEYFDLLGRRVDKPQSRGLYIQHTPGSSSKKILTK